MHADSILCHHSRVHRRERDPLDEPTATLGELLRALSARYGPAFRRWVLDQDELGQVVLIVINGHDARHQGGINARLSPGRYHRDLSGDCWRARGARSPSRSGFSKKSRWQPYEPLCGKHLRTHFLWLIADG